MFKETVSPTKMDLLVVSRCLTTQGHPVQWLLLNVTKSAKIRTILTLDWSGTMNVGVETKHQAQPQNWRLQDATQCAVQTLPCVVVEPWLRMSGRFAQGKTAISPMNRKL